MIRFIIICIILVGFLILSIPILIVEWIIGKFNRRARDISSLRIVQAVFRFMLWITGVKITVIGEDRIPKDQAVLYIGNHRSFFDILLTYSRCHDLTGYVAKKEMLKAPLLNFWMMYLYCLFLDRVDIKEGLKTILKGIDQIKRGISVCIFPEGTRNKGDSDLEPLPFHEGSFKLATKPNCPIIPIAMNNTAQIWENHFPKIKPCHVILEYGEPIIPSQLEKADQKRIGAYTRDVMIGMLKKNAGNV